MPLCVYYVPHVNLLIRNMSMFGMSHYAGVKNDAMQERENDKMGFLADLLTY